MILVNKKIPIVWKLLRFITYNFPSKVSANSKNCILQLEKFVSKKKLIYLPNVLSTKNKKSNVKKKNIFSSWKVNISKRF